MRIFLFMITTFVLWFMIFSLVVTIATEEISWNRFNESHKILTIILSGLFTFISVAFFSTKTLRGEYEY